MTVTAELEDGTKQRFTGTSTLRRVNDVQGATPEELAGVWYQRPGEQVIVSPRLSQHQFCRKLNSVGEHQHDDRNRRAHD